MLRFGVLRPLGPVEFADQVLGLELWPSQRMLVKLLYGIALVKEERELLETWRRGDPEFGGDIVVEEGVGYRELALVCGMRASKTFMAAFLGCYECYLYLSLDNPWRHYGIARDSPVFGMIAATSRERQGIRCSLS